MSTLRKRRSERGFTLAEVLVTTAIVGSAFVGVSWLMTSAGRTHELYLETETDTLQLAREVRELAMGVKNVELNGLGPALTAADVEALDNLDGAVFSPPVRADGTVMSQLSGWSQKIDVSLHEKTLTKVTKNHMQKTANALVQPKKGSGSMYRLEVTIHDGTQDVGTYEWWIKP